MMQAITSGNVEDLHHITTRQSFLEVQVNKSHKSRNYSYRNASVGCRREALIAG